MNKISLSAAVVAASVLSFTACQKAVDTPAPQEEVQVEEPEVKSVARILNSTAEEPEVLEAVENLLIDIKKGSDWHHMALSVTGVDEEGAPVNYLTGEVGVVRGKDHLLEIDLNLLIRDFITITGTLDPVTIVPNYTKAILAKTDVECDYYLLQANDGLNITILDYMTLSFMRTENEDGLRIVDLFLATPYSEPVALSEVLALLLD